MILYQGYSYIVFKQSGSRIYWLCKETTHCHTEATTEDSAGSALVVTGSHTHAVDPTNINLVKGQQSTNRKAGKTSFVSQ